MTDYTRLEEELNNIKYKGIGIGSLLSLEFFLTQKGIYKKKGLKEYLIFIKILIRALLKKIPVFPHKTVLYYKSGDKYHHNKISSSFLQTFKSIVITGGSREAMIKSPVFKANFKQLFFVLRWGINNYPTFNMFLKKHHISKNTFNLFVDLIINSLRFNYWDDFFNKNTIRILGGDYDRGNASVPIYLAAKKYQIPSIVIQHGVINPPYGFTPLIAGKVFVWGNMQKNQFLKLGVEKHKIKITGTPIVDKIKKKGNSQLGKKKNIVLAVNPIKKEFIKKQIQDFSVLSKGDEYDLYIKIHPSQSVKTIKELVENKSVSILRKDIDFTDFVEFCDVLVTHNSGLANECILNDIPVIILDNLPVSAGNGLELHEFCRVPLVKDSNELNRVIKNIESISIRKEDLYFKTGEEAKREIKKEILKILDH